MRILGHDTCWHVYFFPGCVESGCSKGDMDKPKYSPMDPKLNASKIYWLKINNWSRVNLMGLLRSKSNINYIANCWWLWCSHHHPRVYSSFQHGWFRSLWPGSVGLHDCLSRRALEELPPLFSVKEVFAWFYKNIKADKKICPNEWGLWDPLNFG